MNHKLTSLAGTTGKQSPKDSHIQTTLQRSKRHLREGNILFRLLDPQHRPVRLVGETGATAGSGPRAVVLGQIVRVHGDHAADARGEHALPLALADLFAMVGASDALGFEFLLEVGAKGGGRGAHPRQVKQVVFAP